MQIQIKQILKYLFLLIKQLSLLEKVIYSFFIIILAQVLFKNIYELFKKIANYVSANYQTIFAIGLGITLFGLGLYLFFVRSKCQPRELEASLDDTATLEQKIANERTIYTEGNYNENIHGNYIEIHGNYIDINNDFPSVVSAQINELIQQLKNQGFTQENAETEIANELAQEASIKPKVKKAILKWRKSFPEKNTKNNDDIQIAREVIKSASHYSYSSSKDFTEVVGGYYQKLEELLQRNKYEEADLMTAEIIYNIAHNKLPESSYAKIFTYTTHQVCSEHLKVIPRKDLEIINKLWLKHSSGRFGFSVQKKIWKSVGGGCDTDFTDSEVEEKFGDLVGWRKQGNWLYYVDLYDSLRKAPPGHLPLALMLCSDKSERCEEIDFSILEVIVGRM